MKSLVNLKQLPPQVFSVFIGVCTLINLVGCTSGWRAAAINLPEGALEKAVEEAQEDPLFQAFGDIPQNWWTLFDDEQLSQFVELTLTRNPDLYTARANIALAMVNANRVRANLLPNLIWGADVSRQKFSETGIIPFNTTPQQGAAPIAATGGVNGIPVYFTQYETEFTLTYDFDVWGKNRNTWKAYLNEVKARMADDAFIRLQLAVAVAEVYFDLQVAYKRQEIAQAQVKNRTTYLDFIQKRIKANVENALNLNLAEFNLATAKDGLLQVQNDIAVYEHLLKSYVAGNFEEEVKSIEIATKSLPKVPLPGDIPLNLIARRPDIISQIWLIESANKQIDVAIAGFYPDFNLSAIFGFQTIHLSKWFEYASVFYNVDPAVSLPVYDGGRLNANLRGSEINYDLAVFKYNQLVLQATREVLDGISILRNSNQQFEQYHKAANFQEQTNKLTILRKNYHLDSTLDTLTSESVSLNAQDQEAIALGKTIRAMLELIKALGGGYDTCCKEAHA